MFKYIKSLLKYAFIGVTLVAPLKAANLEPLTIRDFSCGLVTSYDPTVINDGCAQEGWNIDVWTGRLQKRRGSTLQNSSALTGNQAVRFLKEFPDQSGNKWLISVSSNTVFKSNNSGAINSVLTSTYGVTSSSLFSSINAYGKIRLVDGTTNCLVFDGTTLTVSTATPRGTTIAFMFERVWVGGVAGDNSDLFLSRLGDPEDWTDGGLSDADAGSLFIRQNDGYPIRALVPYGNTLLIFKDRSIDALTMDNSGLVPIVTAISNTIGTQHPKSIQVRYNDVIFMGPDGFYSLQGNTLTNISQGIKPTFDSILQKNSTSRSFTETLQADFQAGTAQGLSASISPNSLVLSTVQFIDNTTAQFIQGQIGTNLSTTAIQGAVTLSGAFEDFLDNNYTNNPTWLLYGTTPTLSNQRVTWTSGNSSTFLISTVAIVPGEVLFCDVESHADTTLSANRIVLSTFPITSSVFSTNVSAPFSGDTIVLDYYGADSLILIIGTTPFVTDVANAANAQERIALSLFPSSVTFHSYGGSSDVSATHGLATAYNFLSVGIATNAFSGPSVAAPISFSNIFIATGQIHNAGGFATYIPTSSTFTSRNYPLSASGVWYGTGTLNSILNSSTATFSVYGDSNTAIDLTNNSTWISSATIVQTQNNTSTGSFVISNSSTVYYSVNLVRSSTANAFSLLYPAFTQSQLDFRYSTGTYLGQSISLSNISAFSTFNENHNLNSGSVSFNIYSDTETTISTNNTTTFIASQTITDGNVPSIATASYGRVLYSASITSYFQNPQLLDYTVNWLQGSANFPVASLFFEGDYLAAVSTKSTTANDTIFVYDRNNHWSPPYTGLNCYSLTLYNQQAYCGDSGVGNIYRIQVDNLYSDNSASIYSYWKGKEFDFGYPMTDKSMQRYHITAKYNATSSIDFAYGVNRGATTSTTLSLSSTAGAFRKVIVPTDFNYNQGITHSFSFRNNTVNEFFDLLSVELYPRLETLPNP